MPRPSPTASPSTTPPHKSRSPRPPPAGADWLIASPDADSEAPGHQVALTSPQGRAPAQTSIVIVVRSADQLRLDSYTITVTRDPPALNDPSLSQLRISDVGLNFAAERTYYETSLVAAVSRLTVEAVPAAPGATVVITPADADPDTPEHEIDLGRGDFKIRITVTAPDETTSRTYLVQLLDDRLQLLSVGHVHIELQPTTTEYSIVVPEEVTEVRLEYGRQYQRNQPRRGPHVSYDHSDQSHGIYGRQVSLQAGVTNVVVTAWSKRRLTSQVYNLAITRAAPAAAADAKLSALQLSEGTPITFDPLVGWYWVTDVGESVSSLTLTASAAQTGATVVIEPPDADPALEGYQIAFTGARMRVTVTVTSTDDSATRTYTLSLHRKLEWAGFELGWTHGLRAAFRRTDHLWRRTRRPRSDALQFWRTYRLRPATMSIATYTLASTNPAAPWSTIPSIAGRPTMSLHTRRSTGKTGG